MRYKEIKKAAESFLQSNTAPAVMTKVVLVLIAAGLIISVAVIAPNMFKIFGKNLKFRGTKFKENKFKLTLQQLKYRGLVKLNQNQKLELTPAGFRSLNNYLVKNIRVEKPKSWDGLWRIVLFDIPNEKRKARDGLRHCIKNLGFYQFQKSVWVFPYPCREEIETVASFWNINKYVEIIETNAIPNQNKVLDYFNLSG